VQITGIPVNNELDEGNMKRKWIKIEGEVEEGHEFSLNIGEKDAR